jgi:hypothetical protein
LDFESIKKVLLDDLEFEIWFALKDFKNKQWAQNIFLLLFKRSIFVFLVLFLADMVQRSHQVRFASWCWQVSKIRQSLNPQISANRRINHSGVPCSSIHVLRAHFHYILFFVMLNIVIQQLLSQTQLFAAVFDTF